jgi:thioredoxin 1
MSQLKSHEIITGFPSRNEFFELIKANHPSIVIKFTANWCGPCKTIDPIVKPFFKQNSSKILCCYLDIDENFDLYSFMKRKKMANGVPTLLYYSSDNHDYVPTASISGSDPAQIHNFFANVRV